MKIYLKVLVTLVLGAFAVGAFAQAGGKHPVGQHPGGHPAMGQHHDPMANVWKQLHLTPAQQKKVDAITKHSRAEMKNVRESKLNPEQKRAKFMSIRKNEMAQINKVLNKKQQAELKKIMEKRRSEFGKHRQGGPAHK